MYLGIMCDLYISKTTLPQYSSKVTFTVYVMLGTRLGPLGDHCNNKFS